MADPHKTPGRVVTFETLFEGEDHRWWLAEDDKVHETLFSAYRSIREDDSVRLAANKHHARLYGGPGPTEEELVERNRVSLNVIKNATDAVVAKIGKQRPAPKPLTQGGSPSLRRKARLLERFLSAQFDLSRVYSEMPKVFLDACVFGTGAAKVFIEDDGICLERVFPSELFVDHHDGLYGRPRSIVQKKWVARDVLLQEYGDDYADIIANATRGDDEAGHDPFDIWYDPKSDQVLVVEGWTVARGDEPGRHVICLDTGCLVDEDWKHEWLPFVCLNWSERLRGFWGQGIAEELNGLQVEINVLLQKIQSAFHLLAVPRVFVDAASKLNKAHFNNRIGAIVPYVGRPPVVNTPQTIHPELFSHLDRLYNRAFEIVGVSQLSATSRNPLGADASGVALQTWHDLETERFSIQAAKYEQAFLDLARMMIAFAREIGGDFAAPSQSDKNTVDWISWSEIDMKDDEYVLRIFPASSLPQNPAGRLSAVIQMMNAGLLDPDTAKQLLDYPDLDAKLALDRAGSELIDHIIETILDEGEYIRPEPFMDLRLALKKAQLYYNRALRMGVEEERLEMLRRFMRQTKRLLEAAQAEQAKLAAAVAGQNAPTNSAAPPAPGPDGQPPTAITPQDGTVSNV